MVNIPFMSQSVADKLGLIRRQWAPGMGIDRLKKKEWQQFGRIFQLWGCSGIADPIDQSPLFRCQRR
ncbi:hypothetical protein [Rhizorhapis sp.]|uniref:hypothetical protein n=1 Tax=Rhizorhapis sp. TaxID=1968842 RepID=UPI002B490CA6|nr:hypothetical protein [Rhizorhapis sp.]